MAKPDFAKIKELAAQYRPAMTRFLRDMIRLPSNGLIEYIELTESIESIDST